MVGEEKKKGKENTGSSSAGKQNNKTGMAAETDPNKKNSKKKIRSSQSVKPNIIQKDIMKGEDFLKRAGFKEGGRPGKLEAIERMKEALAEKERRRKELAKSRGKPSSSAKKNKKEKAEKDQKVHEAKRNSSKPKKDHK